jgi:dihydroorotate dehydrogenase (NAD+) catalytic subunit
VLEFLVAGCAAVQVGTASFGDPGLLGRLAAEVSAHLDAAGIASAEELVGSLALPVQKKASDEAAIAAGGAPS